MGPPPGPPGNRVIAACRLILPLVLSFLATLTFITQREYLFESSSAVGVATDGSSSDTTYGDEQAFTSKDKLDDETPGPSTSIFNCDGAMGLCEYMYPTKFFHPENGPGKDFRSLLEKIETLRNENKLWFNMPRIGWPTFSYSPELTNPNTKKPYEKQNVSFLHVHKAGGTTIHGYMPLARKNGIGVQRHYVYHWEQARNLMVSQQGGAAKFQRALEMEREKMALTYYHLTTAGKYRNSPDKWGPNDHLLFAVVRDPIDRFISSMGQAMGASGSTNNVVGKQLQKLCIKDPSYSQENANQVAACVVDYIMENDYFVEVHFTPQAVEVAFATQMYHVPVAMFNFDEHYKDVLSEMGANPDKKSRDGDAKGYRPAPVLTEMKSSDLSEFLIEHICDLYRVDVILFRTLGWNVPRCDQYIPIA